jgi:hypothetical protein
MKCRWKIIGLIASASPLLQLMLLAAISGFHGCAARAEPDPPHPHPHHPGLQYHDDQYSAADDDDHAPGSIDHQRRLQLQSPDHEDDDDDGDGDDDGDDHALDQESGVDHDQLLMRLQEADRIVKLPGQPRGVGFHQFAGYVAISAAKELFYWLTEAPHGSSNRHHKLPLILWLNGGNSASTLSISNDSLPACC